MKPGLLRNLEKAVNSMDGLAFPKVVKVSRKTLKRLDGPKWSTLRNKLDLIFSKYIRLRDSTQHGQGVCISCGKFSMLQCGHFIKRQYFGTRWDEENCAGQCVHCNYALQGNDIEFAKGLQKRYFAGIVEKLQILKKLHSKRPENNWMITRIEFYKEKCKELE